MSHEAKESFEKAVDALKTGDSRGLNDHALKYDRAGQRAIDLKEIGKNRGAGRIIYEVCEGGVIKILEILTDHNYLEICQ